MYIKNFVPGFNSSMVRLGVQSGPSAGAVSLFQFQYGAIGSMTPVTVNANRFCSFNSSMVRLGVQHSIPAIECRSGFNSSMVRLGVISGFYLVILCLFQFQYGAIGSSSSNRKKFSESVSIPVWCDWEDLPGEVADVGEVCFNSSMVRLGAKPCSFVSTFLKVSIPVWCDWEV